MASQRIFRVVSSKGRVYKYTYLKRERKKTEHHPDFSYKSQSSSTTIRIKQLCLKRDQYKCVSCDSNNNLEIHHKDLRGRSKSKLMNNGLDNLLTLCGSCHQTLHRNEHTDLKLLRNSEIYNLRLAGLTFTEVANQFGISRQRAYQIYVAENHYQVVKIFIPKTH